MKQMSCDKIKDGQSKTLRMNYIKSHQLVRNLRRSYMFSVLSTSHARLHWPLEFLWRATLSLSIASRSLFHRRYSSCSSLDVGTFRSRLLCVKATSWAETKQVVVSWQVSSPGGDIWERGVHWTVMKCWRWNVTRLKGWFGSERWPVEGRVSSLGGRKQTQLLITWGIFWRRRAIVGISRV